MKHKHFIAIAILASLVILSLAASSALAVTNPDNPTGSGGEDPTIQSILDSGSSLPGLSQIPNIVSGIKASQSALGAIPSVPTSDTGLNAKQTGIKIFGFNTGVSWNQIALDVAKTVVNQVVDSTVKWMNSGFDPNHNPAFVTDPGSYFGNLANGIVGTELDKISKGALCTPFQAQITLSLKQAYAGNDYTPQCTLTGIVANYNNFVKRFDQGGWQAWIAITQNSEDNPYGAFADAKLTIDNKVAANVNSATQEINWGSGFKSQKNCELYNGKPSKGGAPSTYYNPAYAPGACLQYAPIQTPGATIKAHLDASLPANNFLSQITTADQFDSLLTALGNGILQRFVFGSNGLLGKAPTGSGSGDTSSSQPIVDASCSATVTSGTTGVTPVTWVASSNNSADVATSFTWSGNDAPGDNALSSTSTLATITYTTPGTKTASIVASSTRLDDLGNYIPSTHTQKTFTCSNSAKISKYYPLQVSCTVSTPRVTATRDKTDPVTWTATITGGSGSYEVIKWDDTDQQVPPGASGNANKIYPYNLTPDETNAPETNWCYGTANGVGLPHLGPTCDAYYTRYGPAGNDMRSGVTVQKLTKDGKSTDADPVFDSALTRIYFNPGNGEQVLSYQDTISVVDADPNLDAVTNYTCPSLQVIDKDY